MNESEDIMLESISSNPLAAEIKQLIARSQQQVATQVNSAITLLYWNIGKRIKQEVLKDQRAGYGKQVVANLSKELTSVFGKGWSEQQLRHCMRCAEVFVDEEILYTLCIELSWSHIKTIIYVDDALKRDFYIDQQETGANYSS
ncbi:DUF1016 N-terminal domain-containing protein [Bacteroides timonensis]|uniref:DUF1016 N-terminal domain-containing protein n=1 Tax=Bacteroides timonensis TaxID=1470345 RepID=UPI0009452CAF|nr:DUF1016 N-terminal domain-containing protein [Bacteroides timonensis]